MSFTVELEACVAGNPLKAWRSGEPDDVWQHQTHDFAEDVEAAKAFIVTLREYPHTTTHVVLKYGDEILFQKDAGDPLDAAAPGVVPPSLAPTPLTPDEIPPAPPMLGAQ